MSEYIKSKLATCHSYFCDHLLYMPVLLQQLPPYNFTPGTCMKNINYKLVAVEM